MAGNYEQKFGDVESMHIIYVHKHQALHFFVVVNVFILHCAHHLNSISIAWHASQFKVIIIYLILSHCEAPAVPLSETTQYGSPAF